MSWNNRGEVAPIIDVESVDTPVHLRHQIGDVVTTGVHLQTESGRITALVPLTVVLCTSVTKKKNEVVAADAYFNTRMKMEHSM